MQYTPQNAIAIAAEIRKFKPEIVLAPHPQENQHPDHVIAGRLVRDACRFARYGGLEELKPRPVHKIKNLLFYNITQHLQKPEIVVDISDVVVEWEAVMNCHQSQVASKGYIAVAIDNRAATAISKTLENTLADVFGITETLVPETANLIYDQVADRLASGWPGKGAT